MIIQFMHQMSLFILLILQVIDNYYSFHHQKVERVSKLPSTHREEGLSAEPNVRLNNYLIVA